jgi:broad specificity phosphatase PhoE
MLIAENLSRTRMTHLILIRHGETDWNVIGRYQGQDDPPLNAKGLAQARELADALRDVPLDVLVSSPLRRAYRTAEILAEALELPLFAEPRLMEVHQGDWQGRLRAEIAGLYPELLRLWETEPWQVTPPGGEHLSQVQARVYAALDDILVRYEGQRVGLVAHRIPIALIKVRYQGLDRDAVRTLQLPNTYWEEIRL